MPGQLSPQMFKPAQKPRRFRACLSISALLLYFVVALLALGLYAISDACVARNNPGRPPHTLSANCLVALEPVNHARFASGARVVANMTSPTLPIPIPDLYHSTFAHPEVQRRVRESHGPPSLPEVALGFFSDTRALWFFDGDTGYLTVALSTPILVRKIQLHGHGTPRPCLPRSVHIWGLVPPLHSHRIRWNQFDWPSGGFPSHLRQPLYAERSFFLSSAPSRWVPLSHSTNVSYDGNHTTLLVPEPVLSQNLPVHVVSLEFKRNWGAAYTCFAGLGVYNSVIF